MNTNRAFSQFEAPEGTFDWAKFPLLSSHLGPKASGSRDQVTERCAKFSMLKRAFKRKS